MHVNTKRNLIMLEDRTEPSQKRILHVYPCSVGESYGVTEHYPLSEANLAKRRRFNFKRHITNILKERSVSRKFPRTTREHTEFGEYSHKTTCPNCLSYIMTQIHHYNTSVTHAIAACLIPIGMCIIPYCTNKYKNTAHYCPKCEIYLGIKYGSGRNVFRCCATI